MIKLMFVLSLILSSISFAQTTTFRYEGKLAGPSITAGTQPNQTVQIHLERPDSCGGTLGLSPWSSSSVTFEDGAFSISPSFSASSLASAMNPWNDFGASCSIPEFRRRMVLNWNSETFYIDLEDSPRANLANYAVNASNASAIGGVSVQPNMTCSSNYVLKYNTANSRFECQMLTTSDLPTLTSAQIPTLAGDVSGNVSANVVDKIKGVTVSATAPSLNQVLKYNGSQWAPAADDTGAAPADASYSAKGIIQIDTSASTSGLNISAGVLSMPNVITAAGPIGAASTVPIITYDSKGRLTAVSSTTLNDSTKLALTGGTMSGNINMGTHDVSNATNVSATNVSLRTLVLNDNDSNTATVKAPTDIPSNYSLVLPTNTGTNGQVLATDGTGNLSWVSAGSVLSLTANRAVVANGAGNGLTSFSCAVNQAFGFDAVGNPQCMSVTGVGGFTNGGNSFGTTAYLGTTDTQRLVLKAGNMDRVTIDPTTGYVGVNTSTPSTFLDITGAMTVRADASPGVAGANQGRIYFDSATHKFKVSEHGSAYSDLLNTSGFANGGNSFGSPASLGTNDTQNLNFKTNGFSRMTIKDSGEVGIGTSTPTPSMALDLNGVMNWRPQGIPVEGSNVGRIYFDSSTNKFKISENMGGWKNLSDDWLLKSEYGTSAINVSNILPCNGLQAPQWNTGTSQWECVDLRVTANGIILEGGNTIASPMTIGNNLGFSLGFETGGTTQMTISPTGKVGIGTTVPTSLLHTQQNILSSSTNIGNYFLTQFVPSADNAGVLNGFTNEVDLNNNGHTINTSTGADFRFFLNGTSNVDNASNVNIYTSKITGMSTSALVGLSNVLVASQGTTSSTIGIKSDIQTTFGGSTPIVTYAKTMKSSITADAGTQIQNAIGFEAGITNNSSYTMSQAIGADIGFSGGSISSTYGVRITGAPGVNNYGIYQATTGVKNVFNGSLQVGGGSQVNKIVICSGVTINNIGFSLSTSGTSQNVNLSTSCVGVVPGMIVSCSLDSDNKDGIIYTPRTVTTNDQITIRVTNASGSPISAGLLTATLSCKAMN